MSNHTSIGTKIFDILRNSFSEITPNTVVKFIDSVWRGGACCDFAREFEYLKLRVKARVAESIYPYKLKGLTGSKSGNQCWDV